MGENQKTKVAAYVRMSTDMQNYSVSNQMNSILEYAQKNNMEIVQTYSDLGKSGLSLKGRDGLVKLIADIDTGEVNFKAVLVYDVSRWGRFQDTDESAYYEFKCKKAGIKIHYCVEPFENDESSFASIMKTLKRTMAGEYSRELSAKIFQGSCNLAKKGYWVGGTAPYGLRRYLISKEGIGRRILENGEHKYINTDRVVLVPGPSHEVETVKRIFSYFTIDKLTTHEIKKILNEDFKATGRSKPWLHGTIGIMLTNELYIGNNVYNKHSKKLRGQWTNNSPDKWVIAKGVFEPLISKEMFRTAQRLTKKYRRSMSTEDMLSGLKILYRKKGYLSGELIDKDKNIPSTNAYIVRFGSLYSAYALVGFNHSKRGMSEEELLVKLKKLYKKHGYLTGGLIDKSKGMPNRNVYGRRFGGMYEAYKLVGYVPERSLLPRSVMLSRVDQLYKKYGYLSEKLISQSSAVPCTTVLREVFGSLRELYKLIGFTPEHVMLTDEELIDNLKQILKKHGYISGKLIDASPIPHKSAIYYRRFGNLRKAYKKAGFVPERQGMSDEYLLDKLKTLYKSKGRVSASLIIKAEDMPHATTYRNRFGSLRKAYALINVT